jgi:hypothetical protein
MKLVIIAMLLVALIALSACTKNVAKTTETSGTATSNVMDNAISGDIAVDGPDDIGTVDDFEVSEESP